MKQVIDILRGIKATFTDESELGMDLGQAIVILRAMYETAADPDGKPMSESEKVIRAALLITWNAMGKPLPGGFKVLCPQKPTIGRIVHYHTGDGFFQAAMITGCSDLSFVILRVFPSLGHPYMVDAKMADTPTPGCWTWPPIS